MMTGAWWLLMQTASSRQGLLHAQPLCLQRCQASPSNAQVWRGTQKQSDHVLLDTREL
jgi:hypothetical protein